MYFYWLMKHVVMGPLLKFFGRPTVRGAEHIPPSGGALIASNHLAVADSFYMPLQIRRRVTFLAKQEYFTTPGIKGKLMKFFFSSAGQVPVDRTSGSAAQAAIDTAKRLLGKGALVGIYPEGTRSPDGRLYRGKTGAARMAIESGVPIIPVVMVGTDEVNPIGSRMWRRGHVQTIFGPPVKFDDIDLTTNPRAAERLVTNRIMKALQDLSGQEYVDLYAAKVKAVMDRTGQDVDTVVRDLQAASAHQPTELDQVPDAK